MQDYKYLFGPVPSRRFGRSLGVDLLTNKTCCLDCIFCQLGRTANKTVQRKAVVPVDKVRDELAHWLEHDGAADYITLSGSGEPTLHSKFGSILSFLRQVPIPSVLLTNGVLFSDPEVRAEAARADIVKVSLSAWDQHSFGLVNRPHPELVFTDVVNGLRDFRQQYGGEIRLEVFLLYGMNAAPENVEKIAAQAQAIQPDRIQLNTVTRPPAEDFAHPLTHDQLAELAGRFTPAAEVIEEGKTIRSERHQATEASILAMIRRRSCTRDQIEDVFGLNSSEISKYLGKLLRDEQIYTVRRNLDLYYSAWDTRC